MTKFEKLSIAFNLIQFIALAIGGIILFLYLDVPKEAREHAKLSIDASKLIQDIRPKISLKCDNEARDPHTIYVYCRVKNFGSHRVIVSEPSPSIVTNNEKRYSKEDVFRIAEIEHSNGNSLPSNSEAYVAYYLKFKIDDEFVPDFDKFKINTLVVAKTDSIVLKVANRLLSEFVTEEEIDSLGSHGYSMTSSIDVTNTEANKSSNFDAVNHSDF